MCLEADAQVKPGLGKQVPLDQQQHDQRVSDAAIAVQKRMGSFKLVVEPTNVDGDFGRVHPHSLLKSDTAFGNR